MSAAYTSVAFAFLIYAGSASAGSVPYEDVAKCEGTYLELGHASTFPLPTGDAKKYQSEMAKGRRNIRVFVTRAMAEGGDAFHKDVFNSQSAVRQKLYLSAGNLLKDQALGNVLYADALVCDGKISNWIKNK